MRTYRLAEWDASEYAARAILLAVRVFSLLSRSAFTPPLPHMTLVSEQLALCLGLS